MSGLNLFLETLSDDEFEERPVDLHTFIYDEAFMNFPRLSELQYHFVEVMTQIYNKDTLVKLWGQEEADRLWNNCTKQEILLMLGKGSGKGAITAIAFARIVYLLMCLKDPSKYYGKPSGDTIGLLNVATNASQAKNVFFKYFKDRIKSCSWFDGRYHSTADMVEFDKSIVAFSGHSEREAFEGYNFIVVVLDEIAGFATKSEGATSRSYHDTTADAMYDMYKASVASRFAKHGKLVLLSFPRYQGDFITKRYDKMVAEKSIIKRTHTFKILEDLPDGTEGNELVVEWDEDHIVSYYEENVYAIRRPSWEVNPTVSIDALRTNFINNLKDALTRFAAMPSDAVDNFITDRSIVEKAFLNGNQSPFYGDWSFRPTWVPDQSKQYYVHVDLAYRHDRAVVALAHVSDWVTVKYGGGYEIDHPRVTVDAVRYWTPEQGKTIDLSEIKRYIIDLKVKGVPLHLVTYDSWNSISHRQELKSEFKINTDLLSVSKPHYEDFALALAEERVVGYDLPLLVDEIMGLRIIRGNKVDHTRSGSNDISDAVVGAVYNAMTHTTPASADIEIVVGVPEDTEEKEVVEVQHKPSGPMPNDLADFLDKMQLL